MTVTAAGCHLAQKLFRRGDHLLYQVRPPFEDVFLLALKSPDVAASALHPDNLCQDKRDQYRKRREPSGMCDYKNIVIYTGIYSTPFSRL